ncbi:MAG TPA: phosphopantothenate/pantothenate synthetase [Candidatus Nanoarchaeia archaeon]|nr:phosphopantothenate/pantothenate synthetase [Candidatus Nanoarchaeia archaeon]
MKLPKSHPRYESLATRDLIAKGVERGIASIHGLIAHGRGEAFDYLLREKTNEFARKSIEAAASLLLLSKRPVISVNGNAAALAPKELAELSKILNAPLEINIFHPSKEREIKIKNHLEKHGAKNVLLPDKKYKIKFLDSNRKYVNPSGILKADAVFVPLEDGDRTEALIKNGNKVIAIDLNPLSRTAQKATVTIIDNIIRAMPALISTIKKLKKHDKNKLEKIMKNYNNKKILDEALKSIKSS